MKRLAVPLGHHKRYDCFGDLSLLKIILLPLFGLLVSSAAAVYAQSGADFTGTGGQHTIQGRIFLPSGQRLNARIRVRLQNTGSSDLTTAADSNGAFSFRNLIPGSYTVVVEADGYETTREAVYIDGQTNLSTLRITSPPRVFTVPIHLQPRRDVTPARTTGLLNASLATVPERARNLYNEALAAVRANNSERAVERLQSALAVHPNFPLALNELGVQYIKLGQGERAVEALQSAVRLAPDEFTPRLNYGIALLEQRRHAAAEIELRQAVQRNESAPTAHMYLGLTLLRLNRYDEAEASLQRATSLGDANVSLAYYYLGGIYWRKHEYGRAADALEAYLRLAGGRAQDAERVRATIRELRSRQSSRENTYP